MRWFRSRREARNTTTRPPANALADTGEAAVRVGEAAEALLNARYEKFRKMAQYFEVKAS